MLPQDIDLGIGIGVGIGIDQQFASQQRKVRIFYTVPCQGPPQASASREVGVAQTFGMRAARGQGSRSPPFWRGWPLGLFCASVAQM
eukprot:8727903-Lingulodinium_polyedra.AAC.1